MRILGLDLGTKTLGLSITDEARIIVKPLPVIRFERENYDEALKKVTNIINEYNISEVVLGLPKNMDGTLGFAANRSMHFKELLESIGLIVYLEDERLTTKSAEDLIHASNQNVKNTKHKIDSIAACIILETYLKRLK